MNFIYSNIEKTDEERELLLKAWRLLGGIENSKISKKNLSNFLSRLFQKRVRVIVQPSLLAPRTRPDL